MASVGDIVVTSGNHRGTVDPGTVRVLQREGSKGMTGCIGEGILDITGSDPVIGGLVERGVVGHLQVLVDVEIELRPEIVLLEHVRIDLDDSDLPVIASGNIIPHILVATADGKLVLGGRMLVIIELVIPVGVAVVDPLTAAVAEILDDPRTIGILGLVVDTGKELGHVVVVVGSVVLAGIGRPELVDSVGRPVSPGLVVSRSRRLFPTETAAVLDGSLAALVGAALGRDEDDTEGTAGTVDSCRRCVLDD